MGNSIPETSSNCRGRYKYSWSTCNWRVLMLPSLRHRHSSLGCIMQQWDSTYSVHLDHAAMSDGPGCLVHVSKPVVGRTQTYAPLSVRKWLTENSTQIKTRPSLRPNIEGTIDNWPLCFQTTMHGIPQSTVIITQSTCSNIGVPGLYFLQQRWIWLGRIDTVPIFLVLVTWSHCTGNGCCRMVLALASISLVAHGL